MAKREDGLTREQRALHDGLTELAEKMGWQTTVKTIPWKEPHHTEITEFLGKLDDFEKASREAHIIVGEYIRAIERAHRNAAKSTLVFKGKYEFVPAYA